jgi:hypothetical protein
MHFSCGYRWISTFFFFAGFLFGRFAVFALRRTAFFFRAVAVLGLVFVFFFSEGMAAVYHQHRQVMIACRVRTQLTQQRLARRRICVREISRRFGKAIDHSFQLEFSFAAVNSSKAGASASA